MAEIGVGIVTRYFARIGVAGIKLTGALSEGDTIHIVGHTTDHTQDVHSMQLENETISEGQAGQEIGFKQDRIQVLFCEINRPGCKVPAL